MQIVASEELHNLYSLPSIIAAIESRRTRKAGHVLRMIEMRNAYRTLVGKLKGIDHFEVLMMEAASTSETS
jgi:hypothetical protein